MATGPNSPSVISYSRVVQVLKGGFFSLTCRYCGYVPQFKYQIGETFGSHTHKLLTSSDPRVATSNNLILSDTVPSLELPPKTAEDFFNSPVYRRRTRSWGDQKYTPQMVPGYTGYIPKGLHHFGCRYAEICHYAISSFESDQQKNDNKNKELQALRGYQSDPGSRESFTLAQNSTPLRPINSKAKPYLPAYAKQHSISPFYMPDDHPQKYHMSGYTGFVPKARKYLGQSYPTITRYALQEQAGEGKRLDRTANEPVKVFRPVEKVRTTVGIYPKDTGLVPHFTGHIPGTCIVTSGC